MKDSSSKASVSYQHKKNDIRQRATEQLSAQCSMLSGIFGDACVSVLRGQPSPDFLFIRENALFIR